jgi:hypothetical protein
VDSCTHIDTYMCTCTYINVYLESPSLDAKDSASAVRQKLTWGWYTRGELMWMHIHTYVHVDTYMCTFTYIDAI